MGKVGKFITFEGGEGAGKTVAIESVREYLEDKGYDVIVTREPGGVSVAEQIREVILNRENTDIDEVTEMLLYAAARREHLVHKVLPALESGKVVLCDRFVDSSLVYQGIVSDLGVDFVWDVNKVAIGELMPDVTLYMDVDPEVGLARINKDGDREVNRLDLKELSFHNRVREGYLSLAERFPDRIVKIDASDTLDNVVKSLVDIVDVKLRD